MLMDFILFSQYHIGYVRTKEYPYYLSIDVCMSIVLIRTNVNKLTYNLFVLALGAGKKRANEFFIYRQCTYIVFFL